MITRSLSSSLIFKTFQNQYLYTLPPLALVNQFLSIFSYAIRSTNNRRYNYFSMANLLSSNPKQQNSMVYHVVNSGSA